MKTPLVQRRSECSLCSVCTLNGLSQADYESVSDLAKEAGARYRKKLWDAIQIGMNICRELGLYVPKDYPQRAEYDTGLEFPEKPDFSGKGIARVKFLPKRCRIYRSHVVAFEDGKFYDSDGTVHLSWEALVKDYVKNGSRRVTLFRIFK
jgi:hypothetical protein